MKKGLKRVLILLLILCIAVVLYVFIRRDILPGSRPPEFMGIDPVQGEEAELSLEKQHEILQRSNWFFGPYYEVNENYYTYMDFDEDEVYVAWGSHAVNEHTFGPPTFISGLWFMKWEEVLDYTLEEDGVHLWKKDGSPMGVVKFTYTQDAILHGDIPSWNDDIPEGKALKAYEDDRDYPMTGRANILSNLQRSI